MESGSAHPAHGRPTSADRAGVEDAAESHIATARPAPRTASIVGRRAFVGGTIASAAWIAPSVTSVGRVAAATPSCPNPTNVALGGTASMSSGPWPGLPAELGNNGNTDGAMSASREGFHTLREVNAWWEVDLGASFSIHEVRLWNRSDCCQSRIQDVAVLVDGVSVGVAWGVTARPSTVVLSPPVVGQVVRVVNGHPGSIWFHLSEVEVLGCPE